MKQAIQIWSLLRLSSLLRWVSKKDKACETVGRVVLRFLATASKKAAINLKETRDNGNRKQTQNETV